MGAPRLGVADTGPVAFGGRATARHRGAAPRASSGRIDEPCMLDARACVDGQLVGPVHRGRRGREHLAHPVGREGEVSRRGHDWHALCAPAREVGDEDVALGKVQIRFVQNPPAAGAARAAVKRATDSFTEPRRSSRVSRCRPRLQAKLARDRADAALLHRGEVGGGCRLACRKARHRVRTTGRAGASGGRAVTTRIRLSSPTLRGNRTIAEKPA